MCHRIPALLPRILNRELPNSEARRIDLHLSMCDSCRLVAKTQGYVPAVVDETGETVPESMTEMRLKMANEMSAPAVLLSNRSPQMGWLVAAGVFAVGVIAFVVHLA